jgi:endoplasmic reticulum-Golgi intermediate compartment protein 3
LNKAGQDISERVKREDETTTTTTTKIAQNSDVTISECQTCYGAENERRKCCNTCDEVRIAYREKNWQFSPYGVAQCADLIKNDGHGHGVVTYKKISLFYYYYY